MGWELLPGADGCHTDGRRYCHVVEYGERSRVGLARIPVLAGGADAMPARDAVGSARMADTAIVIVGLYVSVGRLGQKRLATEQERGG
jgi:hypothetical protein